MIQPNLFSKKQTPASSTKTDEQILDTIQLLRSTNIGPITYYNMIEFYGSAAAALAELPELAKRSGRKKPYSICPRSVAEKELSHALKLGAKPIVHFDETTYPDTMRAVEDCPPIFYAMGDTSLLNRPCIGFVGARNASVNGRRLTERLAFELGKNHQQVIVSGLARGIDTAAHKGSLQHGTIAVVAGGIDVVYPPENQDLYDAIKTQGGLIVAEQPCGTQPQARHFPSRNRIISALSWGTVVIEASVKSGSLITARYALDQGREVMAIPGNPLDPRAAGPNKLIQDGAKLITCAADIMAEFNADTPIKPVTTGLSETPQDNFVHSTEQSHNPTVNSDDARDIIRNLLSHDPTEINDIIRESGLTIGTVLSILLEFEIAGMVSRHNGNRISYTESED